MNDSTFNGPRKLADMLLTPGDDRPPFVFGPQLHELLNGAIIGTTSVGSPEPKERFATVTIECRGEGYLERAHAIHDHLNALGKAHGEQP